MTQGNCSPITNQNEIRLVSANDEITKLKTLIDTSEMVLLSKRTWETLDLKNIVKDKQFAFLEDDLEKQLKNLNHFKGKCLILSSGDPGFFGILRMLRRSVDPNRIRVSPGVSSVALAFAHLNMPWDDAMVISVHGRELSVLRDGLSYPKVAVLTGPDNTPLKVLEFYKAHMITNRKYFVATNLLTQESLWGPYSIESTPEQDFDHYSVVIIYDPKRINDKTIATNLTHYNQSKEQFDIETKIKTLQSKVTKLETRELALAKLNLGPTGIFFDVGAGSGSVAITAKLSQPFLTVYAIEKDPNYFQLMQENIANSGLEIIAINDDINNAISYLPFPDYVFIGSGSVNTIKYFKDLGHPVKIVANFSSVNRALQAADILGNLIELNTSTGKRFPDDTWHLVSNNPVFIVYN